MLNKLTELYLMFKSLSQGNPIIAGAVSLWGLGVITYLVRDIPAKVWGFVRKQITTTMVISNSDRVYYDLLKWISENKMHSFIRSLSLGKSYKFDGGINQISMGYDTQHFIYNKHIMSMYRIRNEANNTIEQKEQIYLTVWGRNQEIFQKLFEEATKPPTDRDRYLYVYKYKNSTWQWFSTQFCRKMKTVTLPSHTKSQILSHIKKFIKDKKWFIKNGIPWRTGILLYGPPGTGKTSLVKALCCEFKKELYLIDLNDPSFATSTLEEALSSVPMGSVVLIEDIDADLPSKRNDGPTKSKKSKISEDLLKMSLSSVLNAIDGPNSGEGRILIATTNHIEKLDAALLREGRFDLKIKIDYMRDAEFHEYIKRFYGEVTDLDQWHILPNIAPCKVQALVFENRDNVEIVLNSVAQFKANLETKVA